MIHSILVLNSAGEVIIEKHYRGTTARASQTPHPITSTPSGASLTLTRNNLTLLATVQTDTSPILITQFLQTLCETLTDYFGELNEHAIKDNFITVYELLDEMLDNGNPATLEPNALKELIHPPSMLHKVFETLGAEQARVTTNAPMHIPWRRGNVRHAQNEVFVDVTETVDSVVQGGRARSVIHGSVRVNSHLSGLPEIGMRVAANHALDDACYHHCVRRDAHGALRFVPPDGRAEIMRYCIRDTRGVVLPVEIGRRMSFEGSGGAVSVSVTPRVVAAPVREKGLKIASMVAGHIGGGKEDVVMENLVVRIPFGEEVVGVSLSANYGTVSFSEGVCEWVVGGVGRGCVPSLVGNVSTTGRGVRQPSVIVRFSVGGVAVSGMRVESLEISGERYKYYKGLKCVTTAGIYEVRP